MSLKDQMQPKSRPAMTVKSTFQVSGSEKDQEQPKKTSILLPPVLHMRARMFAVQTGTSVGKVISQALVEYLDKEGA